MAAEMIEISNDIVLECIFCCLDAKTLFRCARVCRRWNEVLQPGDSKIWRSCFSSMESDQYLDEFTGSKLVRTCLPNDKARVRAFLCTWTEKDSSDNLYVKEDRITTHRNPVGKSTDSIRTNVGFEYGRHHFVMVFSGHAFGTNAMMGVCTKEAPLRVRRYDNLLGMSRYAWGWDLVNNKLLHNNEEHDTVEGAKPKIKDRLGMTLDIEKRTLEFDINGKKKTAHFDNLPKGKRLYPTISAVYGNSEISMVYCGPK